jgi:hypothetical protein
MANFAKNGMRTLPRRGGAATQEGVHEKHQKARNGKGPRMNANEHEWKKEFAASFASIGPFAVKIDATRVHF